MFGVLFTVLTKYRVLLKFLNPTVVLVAIGAALVFYGYFHNQRQNAAIEQLQAEIIISDLAFTSKVGELESKNIEIEMLKDSMEFSNSIRAHLDLELKESRFNYIKAIKVFDSHDFEYLLESKPELMSNRMRDGTDRVFTAIEKAANQ